jgi:hypothetical protein
VIFLNEASTKLISSMPSNPLPAALLLLLVLALLPAGGRCQPGDGDIGALPPSPPTQSKEMLAARIATVSSELTGEVQSKYGFCMSNVYVISPSAARSACLFLFILQLRCAVS